MSGPHSPLFNILPDLWNLLSVFLSGRKYMEVDTVRNSNKRKWRRIKSKEREPSEEQKQEVEMETEKEGEKRSRENLGKMFPKPVGPVLK